MNARELHQERARQARLGNLGTLACTLPARVYQWYLTQVYDLRFPHVGSNRHPNFRRSFDRFYAPIVERRYWQRVLSRSR